jgi:hypothetical protein
MESLEDTLKAILANSERAFRHPTAVSEKDLEIGSSLGRPSASIGQFPGQARDLDGRLGYLAANELLKPLGLRQAGLNPDCWYACRLEATASPF